MVINNNEVKSNNERVDRLIAEIPIWHALKAGSTNGSQTAQYALFSSKQLISLIQSIDTAFDREPFNKRPVLELMGSSDIPVILMWKDDNDKIG